MRARGRSAGPRGAAALLLSLALAACGGGEDGSGADIAGELDSAAAAAGSADVDGPALTELLVGDDTVRVEIADEPAERERGLMYRDSLPEDTGMLFVYPSERTLSFWMRNTRIPLDIAYVDQRGVIVDIQTMAPQSDRQYPSSAPAMYALEMAAGWFEEHGVSVGDRIRF